MFDLVIKLAEPIATKIGMRLGHWTERQDKPLQQTIWLMVTILMFLLVGMGWMLRDIKEAWYLIIYGSIIGPIILVMGLLKFWLAPEWHARFVARQKEKELERKVAEQTGGIIIKYCPSCGCTILPRDKGVCKFCVNLRREE